MGKFFGIIVSVFMLLWLVGKCSDGGGKLPASLPPLRTGGVAPISDLAFSNYTRDRYPKTFAVWGDAGVARIERLERQAVAKVSRDPRCDRVEIVALSERSVPPSRPVVFVDCANRHRSYVSEADIGPNGIAVD
ncbi:MAG: hypothetical protein Tsb008_03320 [Rhodothalassiaceae bacterium]